MEAQEFLLKHLTGVAHDDELVLEVFLLFIEGRVRLECSSVLGSGAFEGVGSFDSLVVLVAYEALGFIPLAALMFSELFLERKLSVSLEKERLELD